MKKLLITALLLPLGLASCKKECDCDKEKDTRIETTITERESTTDIETGAGSESTTENRPTGTQTRSGRASQNQSNLSNPAPDGTDAENHDNDYYTRNDTSRKPTGTSIK